MEKNTNNTMQTSAAHLADQQAKEIISALPSIVPDISNYGGDELPVSMVIVQSYTITKTEREKTKEYKQVFKPLLDENGKQKFEMREVRKDESGNPFYEKTLLFDKDYSFKQISVKKGKEKYNTLSVIPLRYKTEKEGLNFVVGAGFNELLNGLTEGRTIERKIFVKDENGQKEMRTVKTVVKTAIRRGTIVNVFIKINGKVFSTLQVNGGAKGSDLLKDPHSCFKNLYGQLNAATKADKKLVIDERIAFALGLKKS